MAQILWHAVGKRKTSVARVWLRPGTGVITVNDLALDKYITRDSGVEVVKQPLEVTETINKYDINVNVKGGGVIGQAGAIRHGISRVLVSINPEFRPALKKAELLTRDPRMKERKKYGQRGARARYQYSKR
ncbi:MAG: 30S ribosomal protein S9 [Deltaproteobacteria bacterium]|jgi:small subunit ribosomal protein S9|nr:30S ribosomal protein S9 [Deltaproteobacteria bacterium]